MFWKISKINFREDDNGNLALRKIANERKTNYELKNEKQKTFKTL